MTVTNIIFDGSSLYARAYYASLRSSSSAVDVAIGMARNIIYGEIGRAHV